MDRAIKDEVDISGLVDKHGYLKGYVIEKGEPEKDLSKVSERYRTHAKMHRELHAEYKPDDNASDRAVRLAREKYPWANKAAEALVIYDLDRKDAFELSQNSETSPRPKSDKELVNTSPKQDQSDE